MDAPTVRSRNRAIAFTGAMIFPCVSDARSAPNQNSGIFPPASKPYGLTYASWAGDWLRWILSTPTKQNPFLDLDGQHCHFGHSAPVFLLRNSAGGACVRYCAVPAGRSILLTPGGVFCVLRIDAETEDGLRACVEGALTLIADVRADIDGVPLQDLDRYLLVSELITFTLPADNLFGLSPGRYRGIVGGYFLIHRPMSAGEHVVHMHDEFPAFNFVSDVTYVISVGAHH